LRRFFRQTFRFGFFRLASAEFSRCACRCARFTRLTNRFSKKLTNLEHGVALHYMHYNFRRINQTLRVTPAMEAGVSDHVWDLEEIIGLPEWGRI